MTVEELIAILKNFNPDSTLYYVLKDNNKIKISDIVAYEYNRHDIQDVAFYLKAGKENI